jgi:hypothetical protein
MKVLAKLFEMKTAFFLQAGPSVALESYSKNSASL